MGCGNFPDNTHLDFSLDYVGGFLDDERLMEWDAGILLNPHGQRNPTNVTIEE